MSPPRLLRRRRAAREAAAVECYRRRRLLREDVTVFGEELGALHVDTLTRTRATSAEAAASGADR